MRRSILAWLTLGLLCLVVGEALSDVLVSSPLFASRAAGVADTAVPVVPVDSALAATASRAALVAPAGPVSTVDRLARLAARRQLSGAAAGKTYLDSLILTTDSVVRRWPDRRAALRVAIVEGGPPAFRSAMGSFVRRGLDVWQTAGVGIRFDLVADTAGADIVVRWIDRFTFDRAGQTDLTWDQLGHIRRAAISLAVHTNGGILLPDDALFAVAVHELGHAIGLPHSPDAADVMYPATRTGRLTERDRLTAHLLYQLSPGSVRDSVD